MWGLGAAHSGRMWGLGGGSAGIVKSPGEKKTTTSEWVDCANATRAFDKDMVSSLRGDMDTLLVFASLFSAVVTAFVIQSYPGLSGTSSADTSAALLQHLLLHAQSGSAIIDATESTSSAASTSSVWINALWFSSLVVSLNTVLGAILAKQWLSEYELATCSITTTSPREQVALRQLAFDSLGRWKVTTIINYLPVQLICALFLFFAGLVYLVWTLSAPVAIITSVLVAISTVFFLATTLLPSFFELCAFCSPQSWLCFYLSRTFLQTFHHSASSQLFAFTDSWIDTFSSALSRPSEFRMYEVRGLSWIYDALAAWEPSLSLSLYSCATRLLPDDMARLIHSFWSNGSSPIAESVLQARSLFSNIGPDRYWKLYADLLDSIRSKTGEDETSVIVFCTLQLILCGEGFSNERADPVVLPGLTHLTHLLPNNLTPHDTALRVNTVLSYIAAQENLLLPTIDAASLSSLELLTTQVARLGSHIAFPALSQICIRLWAEIWFDLGRKVDWSHLKGLLHAMRSAVQAGQPDVSTAIAQWMLFGLNDRFIRAVRDEEGGEDILGGLGELALCFRHAHDDGLALPDTVVESIDLLIVSMGSPEAVCTTIARATYSGVADPFSKKNMEWWGDKLGNDRGRVFLRLCDYSPLAILPSTPHPWQIARLRIICTAAHCWLLHRSYYDDSHETAMSSMRALPLILAACTLNESVLKFWFPGMTSPRAFLTQAVGELVTNITVDEYTFADRDDQLILAKVMQCAVQNVPSSVDSDPTPFISLVTSSLELAVLCKPGTTKADLVVEFGNLLDAMASFTQIQNKNRHSTSIKEWLIKIAKFVQSPMLESPRRAEPFIHAARNHTNTIEGLSDVESFSHLVDWAEGRED
ncbi:hypothetical protein DFH06DRAFT_1194943 [Mycena polygramma]|nr:hypothetical protein DFH06DRAFT_1194943 [Mycena polygramma]